MTEQYQQPDINNGRNFVFREFQVGATTLTLQPRSQLVSTDTSNTVGTVTLPSANASGLNAEITIVAGSAAINALTIALSPGDTFVASAGITLPAIVANNVATTFKSNGADNWIAVSQS